MYDHWISCHSSIKRVEPEKLVDLLLAYTIIINNELSNDSGIKMKQTLFLYKTCSTVINTRCI